MEGGRPRMLSLLRSLGRYRLLAVLLAAAGSPCARFSGTGGGDYGVDERDGDGNASEGAQEAELSRALAALESELLCKHDVASLPVLPSPSLAKCAAAAAGVVMCGNPRCTNMEGPSEAGLPIAGRGKTCARCRAVPYCCRACHLEHWRNGHSQSCPGASGCRGGDGSGDGQRG
ncbi:hypothetical protein GPECTOR_75g764 [Gonium pectorale]|uniref:phytol kinase n=1 Tax=Gonium pectorale TaxID=33097 RepID=A0A150G416_GONPE|nr:hypothetical protein GPECTOR_75g764 [Gonium pectorale]|eukprot:KXZ44040.1 hypothetical protein GPECTOR_75g764 [Gonium pectorale]